jgi:hypothetical protein
MSSSIQEDKHLARRLGVVGALILVVTLGVGCPWPFLLVDAGAEGEAWEDTNCNGVRDSNEAPLAGVCLWASLDAGEPTPSPEECANEHLQTDSKGRSDGEFFAGASCNDVYIFAQAPDGFCPTTDTVVNDCIGEFGFAPIGLCPPQVAVTTEESNPPQESPLRVLLYLCWFVVFPSAATVGGFLLLRRLDQGSS